MLGYIDETGSGSPVEGGMLRLRLAGDPSTLNAVLQTGEPEQQVLQLVVQQGCGHSHGTLRHFLTHTSYCSQTGTFLHTVTGTHSVTV